MTIEYSVETQTYENKIGTRSGKLISAIEGEKLVGQTGYLEWNIEDYENNDRNTARLRRVHSWLVIIVHREGIGIGSELMERLFDEIARDGFEQLIIPKALFSSKRFYDKVISRLKEKGKILSCEVDVTVYPTYVDTPYLLFNQNVLTKYDILLKT